MKSWLLLFGMMSCLFLAARADDTPLPDAIPTKLNIYVGGFLGPSYSVELKGDVLIYKYSYEGKNSKTISIKPGKKAWSRFIDEINSVKLFRWSPLYANPNVFDGTHWMVDLEFNTRKIHTQGDNNYPTDGNETKATNSADPSSTFSHFCRALSQLTGQPFE